ncbi:hypothetical protein M1146_05090, partial [Patescibacteria group bacterium]|nr:hypothetical protein [Patescibacteria group bacterium]
TQIPTRYQSPTPAQAPTQTTTNLSGPASFGKPEKSELVGQQVLSPLVLSLPEAYKDRGDLEVKLVGPDDIVVGGKLGLTPAGLFKSYFR